MCAILKLDRKGEAFVLGEVRRSSFFFLFSFFKGELLLHGVMSLLMLFSLSVWPVSVVLNARHGLTGMPCDELLLLVACIGPRAPILFTAG